MTSRTKLWALSAGALAMSLALAGCGGGGSSSSSLTTPGGNDAPPSVQEPAQDEPRGAAALFVAAQDARTAATTAAMMAADAVKDATKYSEMIGTAEVNGDSAMAVANAQKVLDAKAAADMAVMDAEAALMDAKDAKTEAEALPEDDASRESLIAALDAAIAEAEKQVMAAKAEADGMPLKDAVALITGADANDPMTPNDAGQTVAMAIGGALGPTSAADGGATRVTHSATSPTFPTPDDDVVMMNDAMGMIWEDIVGSANVMEKRIASGGGTTAVKAASVAGMILTGSNQTVGNVADGTAPADAIYMGIPGTVFCEGDNCMVEDVTDDTLTNPQKLVGSWYFTPDSPEALYIKGATDTVYSPDTMYTSFGHWLVVDNNGDATVNTYAWSAGNTSGLDVTTVNTSGTLTDEEATYNGTAVGMSLHKDIDAHGNAVDGTLQSGSFTADVTLTAKFGTSPMLGGMIDNFQGAAVDSTWSVKLTETAFTGAAVTNGVADASGQDGEWSATGYGANGERPAGIFGGFNAHFTDGHAAGAYATRKQ